LISTKAQLEIVEVPDSLAVLWNWHHLHFTLQFLSGTTLFYYSTGFATGIEIYIEHA